MLKQNSRGIHDWCERKPITWVFHLHIPYTMCTTIYSIMASVFATNYVCSALLTKYTTQPHHHLESWLVRQQPASSRRFLSRCCGGCCCLSSESDRSEWNLFRRIIFSFIVLLKPASRVGGTDYATRRMSTKKLHTSASTLASKRFFIDGEMEALGIFIIYQRHLIVPQTILKATQRMWKYVQLGKQAYIEYLPCPMYVYTYTCGST